MGKGSKVNIEVEGYQWRHTPTWERKSKKPKFIAANPGLEEVHYKYRSSQAADKLAETVEDIARRTADTFKWGAAIITKEIEYIKVLLYKKQMRPMTRRTMLSKIGGESHTMDISSKIRHGPTTRQYCSDLFLAQAQGQAKICGRLGGGKVVTRRDIVIGYGINIFHRHNEKPSHQQWHWLSTTYQSTCYDKNPNNPTPST